MQEIDFLGVNHNSTKRDYVGRVTAFDKAECAEKAKQWGADYWDGERQFGYGGYKYDGRWRSVAEAMIAQYGLTAKDRILDVGCGKGYLLYEFTQLLPGIDVVGLDISDYAIDNAKPEIKDKLQIGSAIDLPFESDSFDYVFSLITFHNLYIYDLMSAVKEVERVGKNHKYIAVESYRNEREKANLLYWQLTCEAFYTPEEWKWLYQEAGYAGDYGFIYFV